MDKAELILRRRPDKARWKRDPPSLTDTTARSPFSQPSSSKARIVIVERIAILAEMATRWQPHGPLSKRLGGRMDATAL